MTSPATHRTPEKIRQTNSNDGNTSDDSLLFMTDDQQIRAPLLSIEDCDEMEDQRNRSLQSPSLSTHCHVPDDTFDYGARNRLIFVLIICILFMGIEIAGGVLSNSTAVVTDAAHMAIDVASFLISLTAMYLATKQPTKRLSFGYIRAEVLGALVSVLAIWLVTGVLVYMAIERCINQNFEVQANEMIIVASCGVFFNIVMFLVLHLNLCGKGIPHGHSHGGGGHGHSHSATNHGHAHDHQTPNASSEALVLNMNQNPADSPVKTKNSSKNINVRAAIIHVIGDFVQSVGVLAAAIVIKFKPEYKLADPICTFVFSVLVLFTTITIMRDIVLVLMEGVPSNVNYSGVVRDLLRIPGVRNAHSLHIWSLSMQRTALSVHIAIEADSDYLTTLHQVQEMLRNEHSIARTTIQVEPFDEHVMNNCRDCRVPNS